MKIAWRMVLVFLGMLVLLSLLSYFGGLGFGLSLVFVDCISFLLIFSFSTLASLTNYSFKEGWQMFRRAFGNRTFSLIEIQQAVLFFRNLGLYILLSGVLGFIAGVIFMMVNLEDTSSVGPNMAVALLALFYAVVIRQFFIQPLLNSLEQRALDSNE